MLPAISVPLLPLAPHLHHPPLARRWAQPPSSSSESEPAAASGIAGYLVERDMAGYGDRRSPPLEGITVDGASRAQSPGAGAGAGAGRLPPPPGGFARGLMKQPSRLASGVRQFASRVSMKVPEGVAGMRPGRMTRMQSSAQMGLRGLRFLDKTSGGKEGWKAVERRFDDMAKGSGRLQKESFGKCIGKQSASVLLALAPSRLPLLSVGHMLPKCLV